MQPQDWAAIIGAVGSIGAAYYAFKAAATAAGAATAWKDTLKNQSVDNCIMALREMRSSFEHVITMMKNGHAPENVQREITILWTITWRRFYQNYGVMLRYFKEIDPYLTNPVESNIRVLYMFYTGYQGQPFPDVGQDRLDELNNSMINLCFEVQELMQKLA